MRMNLNPAICSQKVGDHPHLKSNRSTLVFLRSVLGKRWSIFSRFRASEKDGRAAFKTLRIAVVPLFQYFDRPRSGRIGSSMELLDGNESWTGVRRLKRAKGVPDCTQEASKSDQSGL